MGIFEWIWEGSKNQYSRPKKSRQNFSEFFENPLQCPPPSPSLRESRKFWIHPCNLLNLVDANVLQILTSALSAQSAVPLVPLPVPTTMVHMCANVMLAGLTPEISAQVQPPETFFCIELQKIIFFPSLFVIKNKGQTKSDDSTKIWKTRLYFTILRRNKTNLEQNLMTITNLYSALFRKVTQAVEQSYVFSRQG